MRFSLAEPRYVREYPTWARERYSARAHCREPLISEFRVQPTANQIPRIHKETRSTCRWNILVPSSWFCMQVYMQMPAAFSTS